jgi:hypothetical protein
MLSDVSAFIERSHIKDLPKRIESGADGKIKLRSLMKSYSDYELLPTHQCNDYFESEEKKEEIVQVEILHHSMFDDYRFQTCMGTLIFFNALAIGLETDLPDLCPWDTVENVFLAIFMCELVVKMYIHPQAFMSVYHDDFQWNLFDMCVVGVGVVDVAASMVHGHSKDSCATLFRIIRLLRILRIFRIIKFLKHIYMLAFGLVEAVKAIFWVSVLMSFVLYVCAIVLVKWVGQIPATDPNREFLNYHFGGIIGCMLTLFTLMAAPDLSVYYDQDRLLQERPLLGMFFVCFVTFGSFGIVAMLTGVISESMFEKNALRKEEARSEHEVMRMRLGERCDDLFQHLETDADDQVTKEVLLGQAHKLKHMLEEAGADVTSDEVDVMIHHCDLDGNGMVSKFELVAALDKISHGLSPLSLQEIHHEVGNLKYNMENVVEHVEALRQDVTRLVQHLEEKEQRAHGFDRPPQKLPQRNPTDSEAIMEKMSNHVRILHSEIVQQCQELAQSQEAAFEKLHKACVLWEAQTSTGLVRQESIGPEVIDCLDSLKSSSPVAKESLPRNIGEAASYHECGLKNSTSAPTFAGAAKIASERLCLDSWPERGDGASQLRPVNGLRPSGTLANTDR